MTCLGEACAITRVCLICARVERTGCLFKRLPRTCVVIARSGRRGLAWLQQPRWWPQSSGYESDLLIRGIELRCLPDRQGRNEPPPRESAPAWEKTFLFWMQQPSRAESLTIPLEKTQLKTKEALEYTCSPVNFHVFQEHVQKRLCFCSLQFAVLIFRLKPTHIFLSIILISFVSMVIGLTLAEVAAYIQWRSYYNWWKTSINWCLCHTMSVK